MMRPLVEEKVQRQRRIVPQSLQLHRRQYRAHFISERSQTLQRPASKKRGRGRIARFLAARQRTVATVVRTAAVSTTSATAAHKKDHESRYVHPGIVIRPRGLSAITNLTREPVLSAMFNTKKFADWYAIRTFQHLTYSMLIACCCRTHGTNILEAFHRVLHTRSQSSGGVRTVALTRIWLDIVVFEWNRSHRNANAYFIVREPASRTTCVIQPPDPGAEYASMIASEFKPKKHGPSRPWSAEEKKLLIDGLIDIAAGRKLMHTQNKWRFIAHHIMDQRRSDVEVRRAVRAILQRSEWGN
jgi:hypothetical protein